MIVDHETHRSTEEGLAGLEGPDVVDPGDVLAAERHLAVAVRVAPRDAAIGEKYRAVAAEAAELSRKRRREL